jgi:hypothetical protein
MNMGTIDVHDVGNQNVTNAGNYNPDGIKKQGLSFYVEQLGNEDGLLVVGTLDQGDGRAINLADFRYSSS